MKVSKYVSLSTAWIAVIAVATACAPQTSSSAAAPAAVTITGGSSCSGDQAQDLTFHGGLSGHIACSITPPACHRIHGPQSPGVQVLILATAGSKPVTLRIAFGNDHLGTFPATSIGDVPNLEQQGVTLTGVGTWSSADRGGTITVLVEDPPSLSAEGRVSGSLDVTLISGAASARVVGTWTCFKTLAGGDGWSTA